MHNFVGLGVWCICVHTNSCWCFLWLRVLLRVWCAIIPITGHRYFLQRCPRAVLLQLLFTELLPAMYRVQVFIQSYTPWWHPTQLGCLKSWYRRYPNVDISMCFFKLKLSDIPFLVGRLCSSLATIIFTPLCCSPFFVGLDLNSSECNNGFFLLCSHNISIFCSYVTVRGLIDLHSWLYFRYIRLLAILTTFRPETRSLRYHNGSSRPFLIYFMGPYSFFGTDHPFRSWSPLLSKLTSECRSSFIQNAFFLFQGSHFSYFIHLWSRNRTSGLLV